MAAILAKRGLFTRAATRPAASSTTLPNPDPFFLTLSGNDYRKFVVYGPDCEPMYHVETLQHEWNTERTFVFQQDDNKGQQIHPIACLEFRTDVCDSQEDTIVYDGIRVRMDYYLPRRSRMQCVSIQGYPSRDNFDLILLIVADAYRHHRVAGLGRNVSAGSMQVFHLFKIAARVARPTQSKLNSVLLAPAALLTKWKECRKISPQISQLYKTHYRNRRRRCAPISQLYRL